MSYLADNEIASYCTTIPGVTATHVTIATELINSYITKVITPKQFKELTKLTKGTRDIVMRGKLKNTPIVSVDSAIAFRLTGEFGVIQETIQISDFWVDTEYGYFTYVPSNSLNYAIYGNQPDTLEVTYTVGYETVPEKIKVACAMLAQNIKQKSSFAGEKEISSIDYRVAMTDDSFFTSDIRLLLSEYR